MTRENVELARKVRNAKRARRVIEVMTLIVTIALIVFEKWLAFPVVFAFAAFALGLCTLVLRAAEAAEYRSQRDDTSRDEEALESE